MPTALLSLLFFIFIFLDCRIFKLINSNAWCYLTGSNRTWSIQEIPNTRAEMSYFTHCLGMQTSQQKRNKRMILIEAMLLISTTDLKWTSGS